LLQRCIFEYLYSEDWKLPKGVDEGEERGSVTKYNVKIIYFTALTL
jgi:hypothetical protein